MKKILLALSLCASTAVLANDANYHWEFTPTVGGVLPEGNTNLDNSFTFGLRIAKNLKEGLWFDQIELGYDRVSKMRLDKVEGKKPDLDVYHLNLVKDFYQITDNLKLYGLVGGGYMDFDGKVMKNDKMKDFSSGFGQYGLGLKYYWADNFATKLEVRDAITFDDGYHFMFYTLGFGVDFGARSTAMAPAVENVIGDEDGDGVLDNVDKCPGTPAGVVVDEFGCEKVIRLNLGVNFGFDSAKIKPEYMNEIKKVSNFLVERPDYKVILEGHTDSTGNANYNKKLSEKRAASVKKALIDLGVSSEKISTIGYGEEQPIADNSTRAGRAENRRVDAKFRNQ
ncbi:outer membrane fibronectin-binding protein [Campylobacter blaseri]|uniref:Flagellar motor protein MotB n=1 Tax=Campylobacter blaseri TaxID=2042961 RepID=A0A2P8QZF6_9BACT|nr:OmpA family protein [Campylobacter blaseri]PSM51634.1 flagellar motor protein MotB [Campylobacter blaseri]PSM53427.1 flagellar motor protein MotB [Campylobacter blaseri]QKF86723.1 outer membrane fibronectin-binding protein [Campylobacter blaseri]